MHTHTHWEEEARPPAGIGGCHDAQKEATAQDGHSPEHLRVEVKRTVFSEGHI